MTKARYFILLVFFVVFLLGSKSLVTDIHANSSRYEQGANDLISAVLDPGGLPLHFIENQGQQNKTALFYTRTSRYTLWLTRQGVVFDHVIKSSNQTNKDQYQYQRDVSRMRFVDARQDCEVLPWEVSEHKVNYFLGRSKADWKTDISTSKAVLYQGLYRHIDLKLYGIEKQIEYDWIVKPGGKVADIRIKFENVETARVTTSGDLLINTEFGEIKHAAPECYQVISGQKRNVAAEFIALEKNVFGFAVADYAKNLDLIIDPIVFSSYLGGSRDDILNDIAVGNNNAIYITGGTYSADFPKKNGIPGRVHMLNNDVVIAKIKPNGKALVYSTFIGGSGQDFGHSIHVNGPGAVFVTGTTRSEEFPLQKPVQPALMGSSDFFALKLNAAGNALVYSTYVGGTETEYGGYSAVDPLGGVYVAGHTNSTDMPVVNPFQSTLKGLWDGFVFKLCPEGDALIYSTYLGGQHHDYLRGIAVNQQGSAYVVGNTQSTDYPIKNAFQKNNNGNRDVLITRFNPTGDTLVFSTYLGGEYLDEGYAIALNKKGAAFVTGKTSSNDYPTKKAYRKNKDFSYSYDIFFTKIAATGKNIVFSSYFGGHDEDTAWGIAVDSKNSLYITGSTDSSDFPTKKAFQKKFGGVRDAFVSKFKSSGRALLYSSYLGGTGKDVGFKLAVDKKRKAYIVGYTLSSDFPVKKALQKKLSGEQEGFFVKIK